VRLITVNVNGIRAALRRRGLDWLAEQDADIVTLQEVRASDAQLREVLAEGGFGAWHVAHAVGPVAGRAGVAVLSRAEPVAIHEGVGPGELDGAGRWVEADIRAGGRTVTVASAYVHTGGAGTARQVVKQRFLEAVGQRLAVWADQGRYAVLTGDLNVAHREDDLKNWRGNLNTAGFLPQERACFDRWFDELGFVDVHRRLHGPGPGPFTWWTWRGQAFDNDAGWRIDYQVASAPLAARAVRAEVGRAAAYALRWSDHAPLTVDYDL
jgi:exodeoxyribonuclease-3